MQPRETCVGRLGSPPSSRAPRVRDRRLRGRRAGSDATRAAAVARSQPAIEIVSSPKVQTLETKVVAKADARAHARRTTLVFGTARFTITVTNPSPVRLFGVTVTDPLSPACSRSLGTLAGGVSIAYSCSAANVAEGLHERGDRVGSPVEAPRALRGLGPRRRRRLHPRSESRPRSRLRRVSRASPGRAEPRACRLGSQALSRRPSPTARRRTRHGM